MSKKLNDAGEMDKRQVLEWVFNALAGVIESWNGLSVEEGERGRSHKMLCLILADDGSGQIGTVYKIHDEVNSSEGVFSNNGNHFLQTGN